MGQCSGIFLAVVAFVIAVHKGLGIRRSAQPSDVGNGEVVIAFFFGFFDFGLGGEPPAGGVEGVLFFNFARDDIEVPCN